MPALEDALFAMTEPYTSAAAIGAAALKIIHEVLEGTEGEFEIRVKAQVARKLAGEALADIERVLAMRAPTAGRA